MTIIATLGPRGCDSYQAARQYLPEAEILFFNRVPDIVHAFAEGRADLALLPVYNTREGEIKEYFRLMEQVRHGYWVDNIVLPIHLSLGALPAKGESRNFDVIIGSGSVFKQCEDYIGEHFPHATLMTVPDIEKALDDIKSTGRINHAVIDSEQLLKQHGLTLIDLSLIHI
jgi:prephenate dehydratase